MPSTIRNEFKTFNLALHFLTRIPTPFDIDYSPERLTDANRYYPLVGAIIGTVAAFAFFIPSLALPTLIAVIIATAATALLTGAFHEDGLADTFDGISGAYDRARSLEIMHDSRIGTFGALALILVIIPQSRLPNIAIADTKTIFTRTCRRPHHIPHINRHRQSHILLRPRKRHRRTPRPLPQTHQRHHRHHHRDS